MCVRRRPTRPKILAGDFNARSQSWGDTRTTVKGKTVEDWAAQNGLVLINRGSVSTCVRQKGESIVDLTWASPSAARNIREWRVAEDIETLSDYRAIEFLIQDNTRVDKREGKANRWAMRKLDTDKLRAALEASTWTQAWSDTDSIEEKVQWLQQTLATVCDLSMLKIRGQGYTPVYWWTKEIAQLRKTAIRSNRLLSRARRSGNSERIERAWQVRKQARGDLTAAIRKAKTSAWEESLADLNRDPWERPYKAIMKKLRARTPPITVSMEPRFRRRVLLTLFPQEDSETVPFPEIDRQTWDDSLGISEDEIVHYAKKIKDRKVPGPDGIPGKVIKVASGILTQQIAHIFTECLKKGHFPKEHFGKKRR